MKKHSKYVKSCRNGFLRMGRKIKVKLKWKGTMYCRTLQMVPDHVKVSCRSCASCRLIKIKWCEIRGPPLDYVRCYICYYGRPHWNHVTIMSQSNLTLTRTNLPEWWQGLGELLQKCHTPAPPRIHDFDTIIGDVSSEKTYCFWVTS